MHAATDKLKATPPPPPTITTPPSTLLTQIQALFNFL